jgi:hypothetical protein
MGHERLASNYRRKVGNSSLLKRGSVFQEWLLSRRTLSFSSASWGVFMQCQDGENPKAITGDYIADRSGLKASKAFNNNMQLSRSSNTEVFHAWRAAVETYSSLELTRIVEDRIVALSGITNEYGEGLHTLNPAENLRGQNETSITACTYSSGTWLGDELGLLWEQAESSSCSRIPGIPTWSWASIKAQNLENSNVSSSQGAGVGWPCDNKHIEIIGRVDSAVRIHVETSDWLPVYTESLHDLEDSRYGNESRFAVLRIRGRLLQVSVDAQFAREHATTAASITEHSRDIGREHWRSVATYSTPGIAAGWASLEHPEYQEHAACRSAQNLVAFFMTKCPSSRPSLGLGNFFKRHVIFSVLYLCPVENAVYTPCYERVGVGRLFETEVNGLFDAAQEESIWLV